MSYRHSGLSTFAIMLTVVLGACGLVGPDDENPLIDQIDRAQATWQVEGSPSYTILVTRVCQCPIDGLPTSIDVIDDEVVAGTYTDGDVEEPVATADLGHYATLNDLFTIARAAAVEKVAGLAISYHPEHGFISQLGINYDASRTDDDFFYTVDSYVPAEPAPQGAQRSSM